MSRIRKPFKPFNGRARPERCRRTPFQPTREFRKDGKPLLTLPGLAFFGDFLCQVNFDQGLIRNIFFAGKHFEFVEHLPRQSEGDGFHRRFDTAIELDLHPI